MQDGVFLVTITRHKLHAISNHLEAIALERIVMGGNVTGFEVRKIGKDKPDKKQW